MKCYDYLSNSTTGGRWARWRAKIHAARCPRCAAVRASMLKMSDELSRAEPLTAVQRRNWAAVAGTVDRPARFRPPARLAIASGLAALFAVAVWFGSHAAKTRLPQDRVPCS